MKIKSIASLILFFLSITSCKKEETLKSEQIHVSFKQNGSAKDFRPPLYGLAWNNLGVSMQFHRSFGYNEGFTINLYKRIETSKTYFIERNKSSQINIGYSDSSDFEYYLEEGEFKLSEKDSLQYLYKGNFSGLFLREDDKDSFNVTDGDFYFKKTF